MNSSGNVCSLKGGGGIFVDIRSSGLDRVVVKLFLLRSIGLPEAEHGIIIEILMV